VAVSSSAQFAVDNKIDSNYWVPTIAEKLTLSFPASSISSIQVYFDSTFFADQNAASLELNFEPRTCTANFARTRASRFNASAPYTWRPKTAVSG
jgi:hypothetical protein